MELATFLRSRVTQEAVIELVRERLNPADRGYMGAEYLPEIIVRSDRYERSILKLGPAIIANDVAPLSTGRFGSRLSRQTVGGGLIDSAAHMHYDGEEIEMFIQLVEELPGDTVRASMPELATYLSITDQHLLTPLDMNKERKRWTLMGTGRAYPDGARDDDFTKPPVLDVYDASQTTVVTQASGRSIYGGVDADFIRDYREAVQRASALGYTITESVMHGDTLTQILSLPSTKEALGMTTLAVNTGGSLSVQMSQGVATEEALAAQLRAQKLPPIRTYSGTWATQVRAAGDPAGPVGQYVVTPYIPQGRVVLVPQAGPLDLSIVEPATPQVITPFNAQRRVGVHVIGRPTGQSRVANPLVFGPNFHEGVNPNMDGDSILAHMPFLNFPGGFQVLEYQQ